YPDRYHREADRTSPYNLFSDTPALFDLAPPNSVPPPALFAWRSPGAAASGPGARAVTHARLWWQASKMTEAIWDWDPLSKGWRRTQNGEIHVDAAGRHVGARGRRRRVGRRLGPHRRHADPVPLVEGLEHRDHALHRRLRRRGQA